MEILQNLGGIASIATCLSLILYITGFLWAGLLSLIHAKRSLGELFIWSPEEKFIENYYIVNNEYTGEETTDKLLIATENVLLNIKAYHMIYDENYNFSKKGELIFSYDRLSKKECILLYTPWLESIPNYVIEWETPTFMKASLVVVYNNRIGEQVKYEHTVRSFIYYLFHRT